MPLGGRSMKGLHKITYPSTWIPPGVLTRYHSLVEGSRSQGWRRGKSQITHKYSTVSSLFMEKTCFSDGCIFGKLEWARELCDGMDTGRQAGRQAVGFAEYSILAFCG